MRLLAAAPVAFVCVAIGADAGGQTPVTPRAGSVHISVRDASDLPIAAAAVRLTAVDSSTPLRGGADGPQYTATTNDRGAATFEAVHPGSYTGRVESGGFHTFDIERLAVRAGARVNREVTLHVAGFVEELEVTPAADDRRLMESFTDQLTPDQLAALPEDPEELALVLQQLLLGDEADIRVDGFSGGRLPSGTQIQEVRIRYDGGSASSGGGPRVEIRTIPGGARWRNNLSVNVRDESLSARNAFSGERPLGQTRQYGWNLSGPLVRNRTGFYLSVDRSESLENQAIRAARPDGVYSHLIEQPSKRIGVWTRVEHQINPAQTIRVDFSRNVEKAHNQGIGEFDLPERAFSRAGSAGELRLGHHATLRRLYVNDFRLVFGWNSTESFPVSRERTVRVLDAFTSGGAQQQGGRRSRSFEVENELEFAVGRLNQITTGVRVAGANHHGDEFRNASGTYTFSSLESFVAGWPTTFTQRVGDATYRYSMYRFAWYVQDDYRLRRNVMINVGVRHTFQTHMKDWANFAPRIGVNWTPSPAVRTTLRGSMGISYSQFDPGTFEQTLLVNGAQQDDLVIVSPGYPDPFGAGMTQAAAPPSIIRARADLEMPFNRRFNVGVDQPIGKQFRLRATFSHQAGHNIFRSRDANAPVNGVRPDASVLNVTELETTARSLRRSLEIDVAANYPPRRLSANVNYVFGKALGETDGALTLPLDSFDLSGEWGPSRGDVRHRVNAGMNSDLPGRFRVHANLRAQSGLPYNITTGSDANGDGVNNERPAGVARNSGRGAGTKNVDLALTWGLSLGRRQSVDAAAASGKVGGPRGQARPGGATPAAARNEDLFRFELFARANNVLNVVNAENFSGVLTSPFFGRPTSAAAARRIVVGTRVWF